MVLGCAFLMMSDATSKWLSQSYPIGQIMCLRNVFVLIPILIVVWQGRQWTDLRIASWGGQLLRGALPVVGSGIYIFYREGQVKPPVSGRS